MFNYRDSFMNSIRLRRSSSIVALAALMALVGGCLKLDVVSGGLAVLTVVSGNNQTIPKGTASAVPLVVRAYDNSAAPLPNQSVTWSVQSNTGTVSAATTLTNEFGEAS